MINTMKLQFESQVRRATASPLIKKTYSSGRPRQGDHQGQTFYKHFPFVGVLRKIAKLRELTIVTKGKSTLASDADVYDRIETMSRVKWETTGIPLITKQTKA